MLPAMMVMAIFKAPMAGDAIITINNDKESR
jgi:hypothetical protein